MNKQLKCDSGGDLNGKTEPVLHGCCPGIVSRQWDYSIINNNTKSNTTQTGTHACMHTYTYKHTHTRMHAHIHTNSPFSCAPLSTSLDFLDINNAVCLLMLPSTYTHTHTHDALTHCFHAHCWAICNTSFDFLDINNAVCLWINWNRMVKEEIFPGEVIIKLTLHTFYQAAL